MVSFNETLIGVFLLNIFKKYNIFPLTLNINEIIRDIRLWRNNLWSLGEYYILLSVMRKEACIKLFVQSGFWFIFGKSL